MMKKTMTVGAAAMLIALAGCASEGSQGSTASEPSATPVLSVEQLQSALLTIGEVPGGMQESSPDSAEDDSTDLGCLSALEGFDELAPSSEAEVEFEDPEAISGVSNGAASFSSADLVSAGLAKVRAGLADCSTVAVEDDGTAISLTVTSDDTKSSPEADDQLNISAVGTVSSQGLEFPFSVWLAYAQVGNNATYVGTAGMSDDGGAATAAYIVGAVAKLKAVSGGVPVPTMTAPVTEDQGIGPSDERAADGSQFAVHLGDDSMPATLPGIRASDNEQSWEAPVEVSFSDLTCAKTLPGVGMDPETLEPIDYPATEGMQACIVELKVTNTSKEPVWFTSAYDAQIMTADGYTYTLSDDMASEQDIAAAANKEWSGVDPAMNPRATEYDWVLAEVPAGADTEMLSLVYTYSDIVMDSYFD